MAGAGMEFAIMVWVSGNVRGSSIFGVLDKARPGMLPKISDEGHWADFMTTKESRYKDAAAAKKSISEIGYYLSGGHASQHFEGK
jgi:hypothetical protein